MSLVIATTVMPGNEEKAAGLFDVYLTAATGAQTGALVRLSRVT